MNALKRAVFEAAIAQGEIAVLVADVPGVDVPCGLPCTLHYGLDMPKPIPDLEVDESGVRATLSFSCTPVQTFVPWDAVVGIHSVRGDFAAFFVPVFDLSPAMSSFPKLRAV